MAQSGELAGIAVGATVVLNVLLAGYEVYKPTNSYLSAYSVCTKFYVIVFHVRGFFLCRAGPHLELR